MSQNDYEKALAILREREWHKGDFINTSTGAVCSMGALNMARGLMVDERADDELLDSIAGEQYPEWATLPPVANYIPRSRPSVARLNDCAYTMFEDIERVFEKAAVRADEIV